MPEYVAVKIIEKAWLRENEFAHANVMRELEALQLIAMSERQSPFLTRMISSFQDNERIFIVMVCLDFCRNNSRSSNLLSQDLCAADFSSFIPYVGKMKEHAIRLFAAQLVCSSRFTCYSPHLYIDFRFSQSNIHTISASFIATSSLLTYSSPPRVISSSATLAFAPTPACHGVPSCHSLIRPAGMLHAQKTTPLGLPPDDMRQNSSPWTQRPASRSTSGHTASFCWTCSGEALACVSRFLTSQYHALMLRLQSFFESTSGEGWTGEEQILHRDIDSDIDGLADDEYARDLLKGVRAYRYVPLNPPSDSFFSNSRSCAATRTSA